MKLTKYLLLFLVSSIFIASCGIYSFSGVNIPDDIKSISIDYIPNQAPMTAPTLSQTLTEKLKDKFQNETKLYLTDGDGDYQISGVIVGYSITPVGVSGNTEATENRLTMDCKIEFSSPSYPKSDFNKTYSNFVNFSASTDYSAIENTLIEEITEMMVQDIFNDIALKW